MHTRNASHDPYFGAAVCFRKFHPGRIRIRRRFDGKVPSTGKRLMGITLGERRYANDPKNEKQAQLFH
jgi:hypothetical protein